MDTCKIGGLEICVLGVGKREICEIGGLRNM